MGIFFLNEKKIEREAEEIAAAHILEVNTEKIDYEELGRKLQALFLFLADTFFRDKPDGGRKIDLGAVLRRAAQFVGVVVAILRIGIEFFKNWKDADPA